MFSNKAWSKSTEARGGKANSLAARTLVARTSRHKASSYRF